MPCACPRSAVRAAEPSDAIFRAAPDLHVTVEDGKGTLAPIFSTTIRSMGPTVYDLSAGAKTWGVELKEGDLVLYAPDSRATYIRGSRESIERWKSLVESSINDRAIYRLNLRLVQRGEGPERKEVPLFSGSTFSGEPVSAHMGAEKPVTLELVLGDPKEDGERKFGFVGTGIAMVGGEAVALDGRWILTGEGEHRLVEQPERVNPKWQVVASFSRDLDNFSFWERIEFDRKAREGRLEEIRADLETAGKASR